MEVQVVFLVLTDAKRKVMICTVCIPNHVASVSSLLLNMFSAFPIPCFYCQFSQLKMPRPHSQNNEKEHCPVPVNHSFFFFFFFSTYY